MHSTTIARVYTVPQHYSCLRLEVCIAVILQNAKLLAIIMHRKLIVKLTKCVFVMTYIKPQDHIFNIHTVVFKVRITTTKSSLLIHFSKLS